MIDVKNGYYISKVPTIRYCWGGGGGGGVWDGSPTLCKLKPVSSWYKFIFTL